MKTTLLFPPQWTAAQPYYGLATLNGQLRRAGHEVQIRDLNLEYMDALLQPAALQRALRRLDSDRPYVAAEHLVARSSAPGSPRALQLEARLLQTETFLRVHSDEAAQLAAQVGEAREVLRDPQSFYQPARLLDAMAQVDAALQLASLPYYPAAVHYNDFATPDVPFNLEPMLAFCTDPLRNPFYRFLEGWLPTLRDDGSALYAISIASFSQVLPGLTLAWLLRQELAGWRSAQHDRAPLLVLGGNFFSRLRSKLQALPRFFSLFADGVVTGEGERSTLELAAALEPAGDPRPRLAGVSSLLYLDGDGALQATAERPNLPLAEQAFQDLSGFALDRYLAPERVVCLRASKGCYYGQCAFCDCDHGLARDQLEIDRLIAEIRHLRERFGVRHIEFVDQCIAPDYLDRMCDALLAAELDVRWFCNARTDAGFDQALLDKMRRAGNTMVLWGVESGSPRLLKLMKKGVSAPHRLELLGRAARAGLFNFAYIFFGFPSESDAEAQQTIDLIRANTDRIHGYGRSVFSLGRHARMMTELDAYGVFDQVEDDQDLSTNLSYQVRSGLQGEQVMAAAARCNAQCRQAYGDPLWMALRSRENLHLYLAHHGRDAVIAHDLSDNAGGSEAPAFVF